MKRNGNVVLAALVALGMLLAACGPQPEPGQPAGFVKLSVALESSLGDASIDPAGAPFAPGGGIAVDEVLVSVEDRLGSHVSFELIGGVYTASPTGTHDAIPLTPGDPSADLALPAAGNPYTFVSQGLDDADVVIAVDELVKSVGQSDTVLVTLESVLGGAVLTPRLPTAKVTPGTTIDLLLVVMANGNTDFPADYLQVPHSDFEVAYGAVEGGTVVASSKRGLRIQVAEDCTELSVGGTVTGLLETAGEFATGDMPIQALELECAEPLTGGIRVDVTAPELANVVFDSAANTVTGEASDDTGIAKIEIWDGPVLVATTEIEEPSGDVAPVEFAPGTGAFSATLLVPTGGITVIAFDEAGNQSEVFVDHSEDVWVWAGYAGGDSDGSEQRPFTDLQDGLDAVSEGGTVHVRAGTYLGHDFSITKPLALSGEGVGAVVIETTSTGYGLEVTADDVTLRGFTLQGPGLAAGNYGIKAFLEGGLDGLVIEDVHVTNYGRSEIDLNTVRGAILANVTADGNGTAGVGIALSGVEDVTLTGVVTTGNLWGSVGLYTTSAGSINGVSGVSIDSTSVFNELGRTVYADTEHGYAVTDLELAGFEYAVFNPDQRGVDGSCPEPGASGRGDDFVDFAKTLDVAVGLALNLCPATSDAAYVQHLGVDGDGHVTFEDRFHVGAGMGIQAAVDAAADGGVIELAAATFDAGFTVEDRTDLTIVGAGKGASVVNASAALNSGIDHKERDDMAVVVLVNRSTGITLEGFSVRADGLEWQSQLDALVFWNASSGTIQDLDVAGPGLQTGAQSGQGLAVDASVGESVALFVVDTDFSGWNKNAIDIVDGNRYNDGGSIEVHVSGGTFTGAGPTSTIGQNGILYWSRAGGTVTGTIAGVTISQLEYTPDTNTASGVLAFGDAELTSVSNSSFEGSVEIYISNNTPNQIDARVNNTFDTVLGSAASGDDLTAIQDRLEGDVLVQ